MAQAAGPTAEALATIQAAHIDTKEQLRENAGEAPPEAVQLPCRCVFLTSLEHPVAVRLPHTHTHTPPVAVAPASTGAMKKPCPILRCYKAEIICYTGLVVG